MKCPVCGNELTEINSPILLNRRNGPETHHCHKCCRKEGNNDNQCRFKLESGGVLLQVTTGRRFAVFSVKLRKVDSKKIIGGRFIAQA
jgi:hypothetical protein